MFGFYRTLLALAVVTHHLLKIPVIGHYAVHGFFMLSGYLMTFVISNTYGYSINGFRCFVINRFLRLYPLYWVVIIITLLVINYFGEEFSQVYNFSLFIPSNIQDWSQNISMVFVNTFSDKIHPRLVPPTWALTVELFFYFLIGVGLSKYRAVTLCWVSISILYMIVTHILDWGYIYRYAAIAAGSLPFSLGALIYHFREKLCLLFDPKNKYVPIILIMLFILNAILGATVKFFNGEEIWISLSYYINYFVHALIITSLINGQIPIISKSIDTKIGDFSYPIYLLHWLSGFIVSMIIWKEPLRGHSLTGLISYFSAIMLCCFMSWILIKLIDEPILKWRKKIKQEIKVNT